MKQKVYITRKLPDEIVDRMREKYEVRMWEEEEIPVPREVLEKEIEQVDGLLCLLTEQMDQPLLKYANNLKVVANMAVGYFFPIYGSNCCRKIFSIFI